MVFPSRISRRRTSGPLSISAGISLLLRRLLILAVVGIAIGMVVSKRERARVEAFIYPHLLDMVSTTLSGLSYVSFETITLWEEWCSYFSLREENAALKQENLRLSQYFAAYERLKSENSSLRDVLHYSHEPSFSYITTRVVGNITGPFTHSVLINAGQKEGVKKGQTVVNHQGLVGRVIDTGEHSARVLLLSDHASRIPVITAATHERGMVSGANAHQLHMLYLADGTKLEKGELVFSSGDGNLLPAGILIGAVVETHGNEVIVEPSVQFNRLEFVKILRY